MFQRFLLHIVTQGYRPIEAPAYNNFTIWEMQSASCCIEGRHLEASCWLFNALIQGRHMTSLPTARLMEKVISPIFGIGWTREKLRVPALSLQQCTGDAIVIWFPAALMYKKIQFLYFSKALSQSLIFGWETKNNEVYDTILKSIAWTVLSRNNWINDQLLSNEMRNFSVGSS